MTLESKALSTYSFVFFRVSCWRRITENFKCNAPYIFFKAVNNYFKTDIVDSTKQWNECVYKKKNNNKNNNKKFKKKKKKMSYLQQNP